MNNKFKDKINLNKKSNIYQYITMIFSVALIFIVWTIINRYINYLYWPYLNEMFYSLIQLKNTIIIHITASVYRVILGYIGGSVLGILIGYGMSWNKYFNAFITPYLEVLRPIPALALIPFFIIWFGIGDLSKVLMIMMGNTVVMIIITLEAIKHVNPIYLNAASVLGASKSVKYRTIIFPASLPTIIGGLRVNIALSYGLMIAAEYLGAKSGLGLLIIIARRSMKTDVMLLSVIIIGLLSFLFDRLVLLIGRYVTRWTP